MFWNEIWLCKKHKTFYYCFDDYPLREADLAGWWMEAGRINIINLDIMMRGLDRQCQLIFISNLEHS